MKTKNSLLLATALLALGSAVPLAAQVSFTGTLYEQNFDTLPAQASGTLTWTLANNSTLPGWYSTEGAADSARASSGSRSGGTLYSFGANNSADRALGLFAGNGYASGHTAYLGLQLINNTGDTINSVTLSFDVEQWRYHTYATTWDFSWLVASSSGDQLTASGYTADERGNAVSLHVSGDEGFSSSGGLPNGGGNGIGNYTSVSITLTNINWQAGEYLWLRWGSNQVNDAAGLGLDNVRLTATQIPEPGLVALLLGATALVPVIVSRRKK
ncbi:hemolysin-type calcium-binding region [Opitutaceae bacterium TAV5]|nr:hemolysin-type calcium-binding region [Opitutaceae bacterium TAV5]